MNDSDKFLGGSASEDSRPRAVNPKTGMVQDWQRASNYAAPLDNPHGLIKWKMRELIKGLSLRPDLARMLLTGAAVEDNAKADEIIATAHAAVALDAKANEGTAVHAALSRSFLGHSTAAEYLPHVQAFASELQRNGLTPVATEVTLLNTQLGGMGHADWIVRTQDGRHLILDVKTGKLGDAKRKFAVQCKVYGGADYLLAGVGAASSPEPIPWVLDQTEAILAHVDPLTGATALYRVDLVLGFYGATLAERVRDWHKIEVLSPYVPAHHAVPTAVVKHPEHSSLTPQRVENQGRVDAAAIGTPIPAVPAGAPEGFLQTPTAWLESMGPGYQCHGDEAWATPMTRADFLRRYNPQPDGRPIPAVPVSAEVALQAQEQHAVSPVAPSTDQAAIDSERAELMQAKNDKATLQQMAAKLGLADLAHNRQWLADWIIATRRGAANDTAVMYAKSKGTMSLGSGASAQVQTVAKASPESTPFSLKLIAEAQSVGDIERFRAKVVETGGDQAWTDEMTEAARARVSQLDAQNGVTASPALQVLQRIAAATEPSHVAALWSETTLGGSVPENWTEEMKSAADARMHQIMATQAPPPANPYGPQA